MTFPSWNNSKRYLIALNNSLQQKSISASNCVVFAEIYYFASVLALFEIKTVLLSILTSDTFSLD